jgi:hypothetical protein
MIYLFAKKISYPLFQPLIHRNSINFFLVKRDLPSLISFITIVNRRLPPRKNLNYDGKSHLPCRKKLSCDGKRCLPYRKNFDYDGKRRLPY